MRLAAIFLAILLLSFGCISQGAINGTNESKPVNETTPQNATPPEPVTSGNISEAPKVPPPPLQNATTNQTEAPVVPVNETPSAPEAPGGLEFGGRYLLVMDDASVVPTSKEPCGIFSIRLASDYSVLDKTIICPGESYVWRDESGHAFRIFVVKVAAGYSGGGSWVDVRIYG